MRIRAFDALGRLLRDYGFDADSNLDLAGLPAGLTFLKIEATGQVMTFRLIKEH